MDHNLTGAAAQIIYGQLEDAEHKAAQLNPAAPHREHELEADRAAELCDQLAAHFAERGQLWRIRVARYRETRTWGE